MVLCFKTFFDGKCDIARNAIFDNPFGKYGRVGPEAYFRDCLFFYELCSFVVREPCLGLSGGLGEPWAPKFPDSAQPLKSLIFIKEYRSIELISGLGASGSPGPPNSQILPSP